MSLANVSLAESHEITRKLTRISTHLQNFGVGVSSDVEACWHMVRKCVIPRQGSTVRGMACGRMRSLAKRLFVALSELWGVLHGGLA